MTVPRTICLGFLAVITVGTLLLLMPFSTTTGEWSDIVTALFTSTSATCVTGLVVVDTGTYYSFWGQATIALLIQVGGLGYMTATTFLLLLVGHKFRLRDRVAIQQSLEAPGLAGIRQLLRSVALATLVFETTGALLLFPVFSQRLDPLASLWHSIFHSISAFNNAGFGLLPDNLVQYATSLQVNLTITGLIVFGGIGYQVIHELQIGVTEWYRWHSSFSRRSRQSAGIPEAYRFNFSLHFKIATSTTIFLLIVGTLAILVADFNNPGTFGSFNHFQKLVAAWFQSVTARTAGFNTVDIAQLSPASVAITIALMFIGASPGSTGGGIKTTTARILFSVTGAILKGRDYVVCYQRRIPVALIFKAVGVLIGALAAVLASTMLIALTDPNQSLIDILFEAVSALGTVGLSLGITAKLSAGSKLVLVAAMYVGRVGTLLLASALFNTPKRTSVQYPEEDLLVG